MTALRRTRWGAVFLTLVLAIGAALFALPAHAAGEQAKAEILVQVAEDGSVRVAQTFTFDQGAPEKIDQRLVNRKVILGDREYRYTITDVKASVDDKDAQVSTSTDGDREVISVESRGATTVQISYRVIGASAEQDDVTVTAWPVIQGLPFEVLEVDGRVEMPGMFQYYRCYAGAPDSDAPCRAFSGGTESNQLPVFHHDALGVGETLRVEFGFPSTVVAADADVQEHWTIGRAFSVSPVPLAVAAAVLLLGAALLYLLHRKAGADAHADGKITPIAEFRPVGDGVSEFVVLDKVRPGHVGTVADERVDPVDVTASILDLAVRGHLRIEELPHAADRQHAPTDWRLVRRDDAPAGETLPPFEEKLLDIVAPTEGDPLLVSQLGSVMGERVDEVQSLLYDEVVANGWYERRPDDTRNRWNRYGVAAVVAGVVLTAVLASVSSFGLAGVAVLLVGLGLVFVAQEMPARTASGAALLAGMGKLRGDLLTTRTDQMPPGREYHELSEVLPFAVVLGGTERWLEALVAADTDDTPDSTDLDWYHGPEDWHMQDLPDSLRNFVTTVSGVLFAR